MVQSGEQTPILRVENVTKRFPGVMALDHVTFDIYPGEVHCLVGENGAGKSTLMKIISGIYVSYEGQLYFEQRPIKFTDTRAAQQAGVAMIHQELNLVAELTVYENIFLGREFKNRLGIIDRRRMRDEAQELLNSLGLDIDPNLPISNLRVGQRQLIEIAKALSLHARLLIMDEPTSALSETEVDHLFRVIRSLCAQGVAIVYISHRLDEIFSIADKITVLRDGSLVGTTQASELTRARLISLMVGRDLDALYPKQVVSIGEEILCVKNLNLFHGQRHVLKDISLEVRAGEIVGIAGLMGAGRTELLETIFGAYPPHEVGGEITFRGREGLFSTPKSAIEHGIGLIAEDRKIQSLILGRSVVQNMSLVALGRFITRLTWVKRSAETQAVSEVVDNLDIKTPALQTVVANLSGGNQQKVVLGKYLLSEIHLFLLDEPTRGIDVGAKAEIYTLTGALAAQGKGFLLVSSELPELLAMSDRIIVLCEGRITGSFTRDEFNQEAIMEAATAFSVKQG